ncbi:acyltransferase [Hymenobacter segetis]|uniref:Acyltransferase n=1 Tax=Hymenobacter segetis TaxID=2025509 RepID=A0ABU9LXE4_9BACT
MTGTTSSVKVYFQNLNAIRFIAAFLVVIHHTEQSKFDMHIPNYWNNAVVGMLGKLGVVLFFALSGFLISYLLFKEQEVTHTISIRDFYMRRMLRIWPLYFLTIGLAFFVYPFIPFLTQDAFPRSVVWHELGTKLALYLFFLPNMAFTVFGMIPYVSQAWSIGAEEQFYLVWPVLNKAVKNKWLLMFAVMGFYTVVKHSFGYVLPLGPLMRVCIRFWDSTPIDCMAIGGLFAVILNEQSAFAARLRGVLFAKPVQWATLLLTVGLISTGLHIPYFHYEVYAVLFGILICNFAANPGRIFSMENAWTNYLGKISYGLYMFHPVVIVFSIRLLQKVGLLHDAILYPLVVGLVVLMATLSYDFFEKRFINRKAKYAKVISGNEAKEAAEAAAAAMPPVVLLAHDATTAKVG